MGGLRQVLAVTALNIRSLPTRMFSCLVIVVGIACVVGVLLSMLSFSTGVLRTALIGANPAGAIIVVPGALNENGQGVTRDAAVAILNAPGIKRDGEGAAVVSTENVNFLYATRLRDGMRTYMTLRGVSPKSFGFRPGFQLVSGRMFQPGTREVIVGTAAQREFGNLPVGGTISMPYGEWDIVGSYDAGGDLIEGQLLGDIETIMASRRQNGFGSILVQLDSPAAFDGFKAAIAGNPALNVDVLRQGDFYSRNAGLYIEFFATVAYLLAAILALGALFGTVNIMHSAVSARTREIATLRALGFGAAPVAVSVVAEALVLALAGGLIGAGLAWLLFDGYEHSIGGSIMFDLAVTPELIVVGVIWAVVIALLGASVPALRAARVPVATALRAV